MNCALLSKRMDYPHAKGEMICGKLKMMPWDTEHSFVRIKNVGLSAEDGSDRCIRADVRDHL
jgi:hypothetical protein